MISKKNIQASLWTNLHQSLLTVEKEYKEDGDEGVHEEPLPPTEKPTRRRVQQKDK